MKRFVLLLLLVSTLSSFLWPQRTLPALEHFDYPLGAITFVGGPDWGKIAGADDYMVVAGNLTYPGYQMPATGNQIGVTASATEDVKLTFTSQSGSGSKVYASFLLNVSNVTGLTTSGTVFADLGTGNAFPSQGARVYIRRNISGTSFNLSVGRSNILTSPPTLYSGDLSFNTTHLIVVCYEFIAGADNDMVYLWINPDLSGTEPPALLNGVVGVAAFPDNPIVDGVLLRQAVGTPNAYIDALRISTSWLQSPLPVELSSFSASTIGSTVKLSWRTETEVNNYGFDVERSEKQEARSGVWEKIGFVNGNGNSNSPKDYSFEDKTVTAGKHSYRLKQIDNDGQFEYSKTIEVDFGAPKKFELSQNYPNPFNPTTTIRFNLPETGNVKLILYNILGQEIRILVNEYKESGVYTINLDASELNSGMYIYKLESGSFVQTRKMTLVK
ncbi:MAG: T9SS type A sorting domain-containing protein [Ignavibacteriales bacterium]|nr:T9SS type A sorting domain-containing protein [Ignavibacteriales bacterium]